MNIKIMNDFYDLDESAHWKICPQCKGEWKCLTKKGICINCWEFEEKTRLERETKLKKSENYRKDIYG